MKTTVAPARPGAALGSSSPTRSGARGSAILALLAILFLGQGCTNAQAKKAILGANDLQDAAAKIYQTASTQEALAGKACEQAMIAAKIEPPEITPQNVGEVRTLCENLGAPIPYDPFKLKDLAGPINAAYETIRAADAVRRGVMPGDVSASVAAMIDVLSRLWIAATDLGLKLPQNTLAGGAR